MKKILIFFLLVTINLSAQKLEKSLLWKIYGSGVKDTSFLFGTIHMIDKKDFVISDVLKNKLKKSDALVMEIKLDLDEETKSFVKENATYPDGKSIQNYLSNEDYLLFNSYLKDSLKLNSIKVLVCKRLRPFYVQSIILSEQLKRVKSYEKTFDKLAKEKEKIGLETVQEQMSILARGELQTQVDEFIKQMKDGKLNSEGEFEKLVSYYKVQDLHGLYDYMINSMEENGGKLEGVTKEDFLDNRNKRWIPKLSVLMKSKKLFIAVGAGHLPGENGVIQLLRNQGYTVVPVFQ
jgi:uncharacterized protein YbaP (TraB family)